MKIGYGGGFFISSRIPHIAQLFYIYDYVRESEGLRQPRSAPSREADAD
jgi:hypothetical protein